MVKEQSLFFIGFLGLNETFVPVKADNILEAKKKFAKHNKAELSDKIGASRDFKEMTKRYSKMIK